MEKIRKVNDIENIKKILTDKLPLINKLKKTTFGVRLFDDLLEAFIQAYIVDKYNYHTSINVNIDENTSLIQNRR